MKFLIKNARIINDETIFEGDVLVSGSRFERIDAIIDDNVQFIDFEGDYLIPGLIDDQVHFREPGLTHKGNMKTESMAAAAGGITSFMEMPNTVPPATTLEILEEKYAIAHKDSCVNYSFFLGGTNENADLLASTDYSEICGIKLFLGSSTGNLLVDNEEALDKIFSNAPVLIATHCEDEETIRQNLEIFKSRFGDQIKPEMHPLIRSEEGCFLSSSKAVNLAKKHGTRLHILHISTAKETELFSNELPLSQKNITSEACVHHLFFNDTYYKSLGNKIKCNPAIKTENDRLGILKALNEGRIDVIATDHAPHTLDEKNQPYLNAPSGLPLVQHSLQMILSLVEHGHLNLTKAISLATHAVAECFKIKNRGYIRPGYYADFVRLDLNHHSTVQKDDLFYKCQWSPLEGYSLPGKIKGTWVNGVQVFDGKKIVGQNGKRLTFIRS